MTDKYSEPTTGSVLGPPEEVIKWIETDDSVFASRLSSYYRSRGYLTSNQINAVLKQLEPPSIDQSQFCELKILLDTAYGNKLKRPTVKIGSWTFSRADDYSANPGALYIKRDGAYFGKIIGNKIIPRIVMTDREESEITEIMNNPQVVIRAEGKRTGYCACCRRLLTDPVSIENGISPICIDKFGF